MGLYDTPAALEFSERQPLVIPLQRQGNRIVMTGLPQVVVPNQNMIGMKPDIGDIAFDVNTQSLVIFCQKEEPAPNLIPVGHVTGGMNYLLQTQGDFEGYLTKK
ncbi:MAG: cyclophilin-like fold protein [Megasphaera elsdenii]|nr:cyclophilin-like fold protein [Megasphaera elsdenii]MCI7110292.1 cyclophilin-like fold protein [Megasphaera elsdenii]MCI7216603.1 cyclophilin-like fold protein [Megasphaera elsdenii]